jgi:uncharacterized protein YbjT (DUF2867 family)
MACNFRKKGIVMNILVTGANGFVGRSLISSLLDAGHQVTALVRKKDNIGPQKEVKWLEGDLLQPRSLPKLKKIDKAFFLVHGLKEGSKNFEYQEAMTAVNFINWIRPTKAGIIYLGGLSPEVEDLSPHLRSRNLTGAILGASGLSCLEFRASIILGDGSISFEMIKALSERLPFRPEFTLLNRPCQPLALSDLMKYFEASLSLEVEGHKIIELGGPEVKTYGELLDLYAELSGIKRIHLKIPEVEPKVLMKALDYALPELSNVGKKLTQSLEHATVVHDDNEAKKVFPEIEPMDLRVAMDMARGSSETIYAPLWEKDFLKMLLSDKILTQSGLLSPELLRNLEKVGKLKDILVRR